MAVKETRRRRLGLRILLSLAFAVMGYFAGAEINRRILNDDFVRWQALGSPPGGAKDLVSADKGIRSDAVDLNVTTSGGETYVYRGAQGGVWEVAANPVGQALYDCGETLTDSRQPPFALLPFKPVRCGSIIWSWEWTSESDLFVILTNGSVWRWHVRHGIGDAILWQCGTPLVFGGISLLMFLIGKPEQDRNPLPEGISDKANST